MLNSVETVVYLFYSTQEIPDIKEVSFKMSGSFFKDFG